MVTYYKDLRAMSAIVVHNERAVPMSWFHGEVKVKLILVTCSRAL